MKKTTDTMKVLDNADISIIAPGNPANEDFQMLLEHFHAESQEEQRLALYMFNLGKVYGVRAERARRNRGEVISL